MILPWSGGEPGGGAVHGDVRGVWEAPYALIEVDIAAMEAWLWKVGDVVNLTHPGLPHPTQASWGVVDPDESTVTFGSSLSGTADRVFWFERHDQAATADTQRAWVYWSAGDGVLTLSTEVY